MKVVRKLILINQKRSYNTIRDFLTQLALPMRAFGKQGLIFLRKKDFLFIVNITGTFLLLRLRIV